MDHLGGLPPQQQGRNELSELLEHPRSVAFAIELFEFLGRCFEKSPKPAIVAARDGLRVGPSPLDAKNRFGLIPMNGSQTSPLLKVEFKLVDADDGEYCRVLSSVFGLYIPQDSGFHKRSEVPVVRVEYERTQNPSAHVHFQTASQSLGWIYGANGGAYRPAAELHFPVGSRRFRPTIEEFLLFLDRERLFRDWRSRSDWRREAQQRIEDYEDRQARGIARRHTESVVDELKVLGWSLVPPTAGRQSDP